MKRPVCVLGLLYLLLWQLLLVCGGRQTAAYDDREGERMCLTGRVDRKVCGENGWTLYVYGVRFAGNGEAEATQREAAGEEGERQNTNKSRGVLCYMAQDAFADQSSIPSIGSYVMVEGICKPFLRATNEGQFDRQSYEQLFKLDFSLTNS
ncbi:MAG: hypothetical protein IJ711_10745, partial [Lachnospiraceae bacterium]|nr:hypothetical protein [Lachnospiraceae bacterium]